MADNRGYYGIIPAEVRYDKELTANEKLLYVEITALTNAEGYCWASNEYFSVLFNVTDRAIQKWLESLEKKNHIKRELIMAGKEVKQRKIYLVNRNSPGGEKSFTRGDERTFVENSINTELNNLNKKEKDNKKKFTPPTLQEVKDFIKENKLDVDPERWMNYYKSNGFKVGRNPMQDWKACVRNWAPKPFKPYEVETEELSPEEIRKRLYPKETVDEIRQRLFGKEKKVYTLDEMDVSKQAEAVDFDEIRKGWKK